MKALPYKRMRATAKAPEFKTEGSVAMDFYASIDGMEPGTKGLGNGEFILLPGEIVALPLGVAIQLEPGYEMRIRPRSNVILRGIKVSTYLIYDDSEEENGTIDSDYRGEVHALLNNTSSRAFIIEEGDRVCQGVITRVECPANGLTTYEVTELEPSERGEGRFGHTGK